MQKTLFIMVCFCANQVQAQPVKQDQKPLTLFSVGESRVSTEEFMRLYKKNHPKKEDYTEQKINDYIDLLIVFKAKVLEAEARGLDTTASFRKEFKTYREELKKPYLASRDELDQLTREAYERMTLELKASHILISVKADGAPQDTLAAFNKAITLRQRILQGEDFGKLAREASEDAGAKSNSGTLGYFTVLQMVYPFEQAAYSLKTGEVSKPVRTQFGYHLIQVTDRKLARGEVEVSHIILRTGSADDAKVKSKIFMIYGQLQGGRSWDELCKEFSDDQATRNTGGRLRPFGIGALAGVPEFETMAFSMHEPGEIADPFQSAFGWHIIRLERKIPIPPFSEVEASLRKRVSRNERLQVMNRKALEAKLKVFEFSEETETKNLLMSFADSTLRKGKWRFHGDPDILARTLFSFRGHGIPVTQFISYALKVQNQNNLTPSVYLLQLYDGFVKNKLEDLEETDLLKSQPEYKGLVQEYREGILLFTIMEKEVWNKASEDTTGIRIYYETNREKYKVGERVRAAVFSTGDSVFMKRIEGMIAAGDSIKKDELKKFKSANAPRNYAAGESKGVDGVLKTVGLHTTRVDNVFYLVQIDNLVPPGIKTLEEARSQVIADYQDFLEKKWVTELKAKYLIKINNKVRKSVVRELAKS